LLKVFPSEHNDGAIIVFRRKAPEMKTCFVIFVLLKNKI
jgi:hypothetical protein